MFFCPHCGKVLSDQARFCSACGLSIVVNREETRRDDLLFFGIDHPFYVPKRRRILPVAVAVVAAVALIAVCGVWISNL